MRNRVSGKPVRSIVGTGLLVFATLLLTALLHAAAKVPYLYNAAAKVFVSYDDPEPMRLKANYVRRHHLAGVMFWEYFGDPSGSLLDTIDAILLHGDSVSVSTKTATPQ